MKKYITLPLLAYILVCVIAVLIPPSDETYNQIGWKLFVGQAYAIPILIVTTFISYFLYKKGRTKSEY